MEINIKKKINDKLHENELNINIESSANNQELDLFIKYIEEYKKNTIYVTSGSELKDININDVLYFYSDKKYNYCKTLNGEFKIKSKLYQLESINMKFIRISKSCIVNIEQVKCFDIGETGRIVIRFFDNTEQVVSRRKIKDIMNYLDERRI